MFKKKKIIKADDAEKVKELTEGKPDMAKKSRSVKEKREAMYGKDKE